MFNLCCRCAGRLRGSSWLYRHILHSSRRLQQRNHRRGHLLPLFPPERNPCACGTTECGVRPNPCADAVTCDRPTLPQGSRADARDASAYFTRTQVGPSATSRCEEAIPQPRPCGPRWRARTYIPPSPEHLFPSPPVIIGDDRQKPAVPTYLPPPIITGDDRQKAAGAEWQQNVGVRARAGSSLVVAFDGVPAVDLDRLASDVRGCLGGEEHHDPCRAGQHAEECVAVS